MMKEIEKVLGALREQGNYRMLKSACGSGRYITVDGKRLVNLSSNDYLGLSGEPSLQKEFLDTLNPEEFLMSSVSSRLISGNRTAYAALEKSLGALYPGRCATVLGSGYAVNTGILPAITTSADLVLADKLVHASLIDGLRLCDCETMRFRHNDMQHLQSLIEKYGGGRRNIWVVTESVFSMDGDTAPLAGLTKIKEKYGVYLYLDEAHAVGVYGPQGQGLAGELGLDGQFDIIVATFGKALASYGAFAVTGAPMKELLVNRMRTLIYSTALPPLNLMWTSFILEKSALTARRREILSGHVRRLGGVGTGTHIFPVFAEGNGQAARMADFFAQAGFFVTPIRYPTVPRGGERVRISLTASLQTEDVDKLIEICNCLP